MLSPSRLALLGVVNALLLLLAPPSATAQAAVDVQAQVRAVVGIATASYEGQSAQSIRVGARLPAGARIETGAGASVDLFLGRGGGVLRVRENSTVTLDKVSLTDSGVERVSETGLTVITGEVLGIVNRLPAGSQYEVKLPDGLVGVRGGTRYRIQVPGSIQVLDGTVVYVRDGKANVIRGPGEFNASLPVPLRALTPPEIPPLAALFIGMDGAGTTARQLRPPPPQELPLSPVVGGN